MTPLRFTVPGTPVPKERARRGKGGRWYTPARTKGYEANVKYHAFEALTAHLHGGIEWSPDGSFLVELRVVPPDRRPRDVDNVAKAIQDAINGLSIWRDDRQVTELRVKRADPDKSNPRVEVTITPLAAEAV